MRQAVESEVTGGGDAFTPYHASMRINAIKAARSISREIRASGDPVRADGEKVYLKSDLVHWGVSAQELRGVVKSFIRAHPDLNRTDLVAIARELWSQPVRERRSAAIELLDNRGELLVASDIRLLERLLRESRTWAFVDPLAVNVVGSLVVRFPKLNATLDRWATDDDFWIRRSALLALLRPLRRGAGDFGRFGRYADGMLAEREFFIRKAIGWVLRETSKKQPSVVYEWLAPRAGRASGVTVREAVKYLPKQQREKIMSAYLTSKDPRSSGSRRPAR